MKLKYYFTLLSLLSFMACSDDSPSTPDTPDQPDVPNSVEKLVTINAGKSIRLSQDSVHQTAGILPM